MAGFSSLRAGFLKLVVLLPFTVLFVFFCFISFQDLFVASPNLSSNCLASPLLSSTFPVSLSIKMEGSSLGKEATTGVQDGQSSQSPFSTDFQEHTGFFYKAYPKKRDSNFELVHSKPFFTKKQIKIQRKQAQN